MTTTQTPSKGMHITLWIFQVLLAAMFLFSGIMKLVTTPEQMAANMPGEEVNMPMIRFIGVMEVLGALGLILPSLLRIMPKLTVWAAVGLGVIMVLATAIHFSRSETSHAMTTIVLLLGFVFIIWGRSKKAPIAAK